MPIQHLLESSSFGSDEIKTIGHALELAYKNLKLVDRDDPFVKAVALAILKSASARMDTAEKIERRAQLVLNAGEVEA